MKTIELKIKGMHCNSCTMLIKDVLLETKGVKSADVSLEKNNAKITFDEKLVKADKLIDDIRKEGYDARI